MTIDGSGNLYVADTGNTLIRKVSSSAAVTTLTSVPYSSAIASDTAGNMYETGNDVILKITQGGTTTTLAGTSGVSGSADGAGAAASFNNPTSLTLDAAGNIYVSDSGNGSVRKISPAGVVTTLAKVNNSGGIAIDGNGNVYVSDYEYTYTQGGSSPPPVPLNATINKITAAGTVSSFAGTRGVFGSADGTGAAASFLKPEGLTVDASGNLYVADTYNDTIRKITPSGVVTTLAGSPGVGGAVNGTGGAALFAYPAGITADTAGNIYVAEQNNSAIRQITPAGVVTTFAGAMAHAASIDGTGTGADFNFPSGMAMDASGNLWVTETSNDAIRKATPAGVVTSQQIAATGATYGIGPGVAFDGKGNLYVINQVNQIAKFTPGGVLSTLPGSSSLQIPKGLAVDNLGNVYVSDIWHNNVHIITPNGLVSVLAGSATFVSGSTDGTGTAALFNTPTGLAVDGEGNVYVADSGNSTIRKITQAGVVTTLAGTAGVEGSADGTGATASFNNPSALALDGTGNLYVADFGNNLVRKITPGGVVTTVAGTRGLYGVMLGPLAGSLSAPSALVLDPAGVLYVTSANGILKIQFQ